MSHRDELQKIATIASVLADMGPKLCERIRITDAQLLAHHNAFQEPTARLARDHDAWSRQAMQLRQAFHDLVVAVYRYLPEAFETHPLEHVRIGPKWRFGDEKTPWPAIVAELRRIEDAASVKFLKDKPDQPEVKPELDSDAVALGRMTAMLDSDQARIIAIADSPDITADDKLRAIAEIDIRYAGKQSAELGTLLKVSDARVRQTEWWKVDRKRLLEDERPSHLRR